VRKAWDGRRQESVVFQQPKGELVGPGKFVNQDTLVANTQGSSSLNNYWPSRHEGFSTI